MFYLPHLLRHCGYTPRTAWKAPKNGQFVTYHDPFH
jgi:hypothetical protein